jgi:hypothetical protein
MDAEIDLNSLTVGLIRDREGRQKRRFQLHLLKLSHDDDDGYVIRWRSIVGSVMRLARTLISTFTRLTKPTRASGPSKSRQPSPPPAAWVW